MKPDALNKNVVIDAKTVCLNLLKIVQTAVFVENHRGTISFGNGGVNHSSSLSNSGVPQSDSDGLGNQIPSASQMYEEALKETKEPHVATKDLVIAPENRFVSTIMATPEVKMGDYVTLIKERKSGRYFLLNLPKKDLKGACLYDGFFKFLKEGDEIYIVSVVGTMVPKPFLQECKSRDIKIKSSRKISCGNIFDYEQQPLHVTYDPENDRLMMFGESKIDKEPSCYSSEGVFKNPENQLLLRRVDAVYGFQIGSIDLCNTGNDQSNFRFFLPFTDNKFVKKASRGLYDSDIEYEDAKLASKLVPYLNKEEREGARELGKDDEAGCIRCVIGISRNHMEDKSHPLSSFISREYGEDIKRAAGYQITSNELDLNRMLDLQNILDTKAKNELEEKEESKEKKDLNEKMEKWNQEILALDLDLDLELEIDHDVLPALEEIPDPNETPRSTTRASSAANVTDGNFVSTEEKKSPAKVAAKAAAKEFVERVMQESLENHSKLMERK